MSSALYDSIARIARHEAAARLSAGVGRVAAIHPAEGASVDHAVTVEMRDSGLVLERVPIAVGVLGFAAIPEVGELVVVVFLDGDANAPVVVGRLYHPAQDPPAHAAGQLVLHLPPHPAEPAVDLVIATADPPSVRLAVGPDVVLEITRERTSVKVGEITLTLEAAGGGRAELAAGGAKITLKKDGDITVHTDGRLKLEGKNVEINASSRVVVTGGEVLIN